MSNRCERVTAWTSTSPLDTSLTTGQFPPAFCCLESSFVLPRQLSEPPSGLQLTPVVSAEDLKGQWRRGFIWGLFKKQPQQMFYYLEWAGWQVYIPFFFYCGVKIRVDLTLRSFMENQTLSFRSLTWWYKSRKAESWSDNDRGKHHLLTLHLK